MKKRTQKYKKYSAEFKISVIIDIRDNYLGYKEAMRKYFPDLEPRNFKFIKQWERIYLEEGAHGLVEERRGRKSTGRPKKELDKSVKEDLVTENHRLRMEIEYLKKLSALVLAEEHEKNKKR